MPLTVEFHLAQVNIGRARAPIDRPVMAGFVAHLEEIYALADRSPGVVPPPGGTLPAFDSTLEVTCP